MLSWWKSPIKQKIDPDDCSHHPACFSHVECQNTACPRKSRQVTWVEGPKPPLDPAELGCAGGALSGTEGTPCSCITTTQNDRIIKLFISCFSFFFVFSRDSFSLSSNPTGKGAGILLPAHMFWVFFFLWNLWKTNADNNINAGFQGWTLLIYHGCVGRTQCNQSVSDWGCEVCNGWSPTTFLFFSKKHLFARFALLSVDEINPEPTSHC